MEEIGRLTRENTLLRHDKQWYKERLDQNRRHVRALRAEVADLRDYSNRVATLNEALATNVRVETRRADKFYDKYREAVDHLYDLHEAQDPASAPRRHIY
jgi:putative heme degradation protein